MRSLIELTPEHAITSDYWVAKDFEARPVIAEVNLPFGVCDDLRTLRLARPQPFTQHLLIR